MQKTISIRRYAQQVKSKLNFFLFKLTNHNKEDFECPICGYTGPFMDISPPTGLRKHAKCPSCNALERHRFQFLVVSHILNNIDAAKLKMLHFAPESFFQDLFSRRFGQCETADLSMRGVDHNVDLQHLPFPNGSYDFVFASHVLEHIADDERAISEIRRVLRPKGIAILPVPIVCETTIEYPSANPYEAYHVRAPGLDYYRKFSRYFSKVEQFSSYSQPWKYQVFIYEDRSRWPSEHCPFRPPMAGEKHIDIVPVCFVGDEKLLQE